MSECPAAVPRPDLRNTLRLTAAVVAHEGAAYLPLLERLKKEYDDSCREDASAFARQLLVELRE